MAGRDRDAILGASRRMQLAFGQVLADPGEPVRFVHFPLTCVISMVASAGQSEALEVGLVGNEGMLGASLALASNESPLRARVYAPGLALQVSAAAFRSELRAREKMRSVVQRYCLVRLIQVAQAVACTNYHSLEARLCRWLLMTQDRTVGPSVHLTHEFLSRVLGVRRVGVTHAASALQADALIAYHRGDVVILDRPGLLARACECYAADRRTYESCMR